MDDDFLNDNNIAYKEGKIIIAIIVITTAGFLKIAFESFFII